MDKYDRFITDILNKTEDGTLEWQPVSPSSYFEFIFQSQFAYQAFSTTYEKDKRKYTLVFVNKKIPGHHEDLDVTIERHYSEILVFESGTLLLTINNNYVDDDRLSRLGLQIEDSNSGAKDLLAGFD